MKGSICVGVLSSCANSIFDSGRVVVTEPAKSGPFNLITTNPPKQNPFIIKTRRIKTLTAAAAINDVLPAIDPAQAEISWQIVAGALAGVTPFVVAGIEFSKRIITCTQKKGYAIEKRLKAFYFVPDPPKAFALVHGAFRQVIAQRRCGVCGGSGLVLRDKKYYFRCPGCGGFLPWQSWKRFFSG